MAGGCMCGSVRYAIDAAPIGTGLCHCDRCRPQSGAAFSTVIYVPRRNFHLTGETAVFADIGTSGLPVNRRFCPSCGSPLTTEMEVAPSIIFIKAGGIDTNEWFTPDMEMFVKRRRPWVAAVRGAAQFDENPPV